MVLEVLALRRARLGDPGAWWSLRRLAVAAAALGAPAGTTATTFVGLRPASVRSLRLYGLAGELVARWLKMRRSMLGASAAEAEPWLSWPGSRGRPRMVSWAVARMLHSAGAPAWGLADLLHAPRSSGASAQKLILRSVIIEQGPA